MIRAVPVAVWLAGLLAALMAAPGCEELQQTVAVAADVVQRNPDLFHDEEDRQKWTRGAALARSLVTEVDTAQELAMGQSLALKAFASFGPAYPDERLQRYVATVGKLVAIQSERPSLPYSFAVVENDMPNALALPGGFIFVSTGLLKRLHSESELACVLGHEVCHVAQKHGLQIVSRDTRIRNLVDFAAVLEEDVEQYRNFIDLAYDRLTREGYDRRYELLADAGGTEYAFRAGYNPEGLLPFLEADRDSPDEIAFESYGTHPDPSERIANIRSVLARLGPYSGLPKLQDRYRREVLDRLR